MFAGAEIEKSRQVAYKIIVVRREKKCLSVLPVKFEFKYYIETMKYYFTIRNYLFRISQLYCEENARA